MQEITMTLKVDSVGRVMIPKAIRDALGIQPGYLVTLTIGKGDVEVVRSEQGNGDAVPVTA
jgi:AbrB family looped-hinge helix DNA binding protein